MPKHPDPDIRHWHVRDGKVLRVCDIDHWAGIMDKEERNRRDARALLIAAYVISRRSDEQRPRKTFVTAVLIKLLRDMAKRIDPKGFPDAP